MGAMLIRHEPTSASAVRREIALDLDLHGVDEDTIDEITLIASELVGNAVRHADLNDKSELDVSWTVDPDEVVVSVEDPSDKTPVRRNAAPDAPNGRGLTIIEALTSDWGYEFTPHGKRVWAKVSLPHAS
jgi:serine/threonine-protein kinase RsbW